MASRKRWPSTGRAPALYADAETTRWIESGLQGYFRVLLGVAFLLLGAAAVVSRVLPSWLGVLLVVGGLLSLAVGISVGYAGLESGFQDALGIAFQLIVLAFVMVLSSPPAGPKSRAPVWLAPRPGPPAGQPRRSFHSLVSRMLSVGAANAPDPRRRGAVGAWRGG